MSVGTITLVEGVDAAVLLERPVTHPVWQVRAAPDVMIRLKRILPKAQTHRTDAITLMHTSEVARDLEWILERWDFTIDAAALERLRGAAGEHREREQAVRGILTGERPHLEFLAAPAREPREYQLVAADLALTNRSLLLADDLGLGKTMSGLLVLRDPERLPALVVCPTHLPRQWQSELAKTLPWLRSHIVTSGKPYDPARRRELRGHDPDVLIINYAKLRGWRDHLAGQVRTVLFDEAQELRRNDSEKYKAAAAIADGAQVRVGLTATPVYNYAGEIHNVMSVLAPDALGTREEFAREWNGGGGWHDKLRVNDPAALGAHLRDQGLMLRRTRKEVGRELPEVVRVPHSVDADQRVHDDLMDGAVDLAEVILHGERREAFVAAGDLDWRMRHATGVAKAPYVAEFVRLLLETERKVVLFGWHRDVYDVWLERLAEFNPVLYTGSESTAQKDAAKAAFLRTRPAHWDGLDLEDDATAEPFDGECRVLIMSLRSGAGLDGLQDVCSVGVFGELDWSPAMHDQCLDAETEILTRRGWCGPDDLLDDDLVACVDPATDAVTWSEIRRRVDRPLALGESMFALESPTINLRVTGGHRMMFRRREGRAAVLSDWQIEPAERLAARGAWHLPVAALESVPPAPLTDAEIETVGWFVTDGSLNRASRQLVISQNEGATANSIRDTLLRAGMTWTESLQTAPTNYGPRSAPNVRFAIAKRCWNRLAEWLDKDLGPIFDTLDARQFAILMHALHLGDGAKTSKASASLHISAPSRAMADRLQSLCIRRGWRANVWEGKTPAGKPYFCVHARGVRHRNVASGRGLQLVASNPGERVWCVTTDTGTLIVRRRGKSAIVGNCEGRYHRDGQDEPCVSYFLVSDVGSDPVIADVLNVKRMQADPLRDPDAELFEQAQDTTDRVRRLAEQVVAKRMRERERQVA